MKIALAAIGVALAIAASGCSTDIPLLHPDMSAAQILALPGKAGISNARYQSSFIGPDGTLFNAFSGTVQIKPGRGLTQVSTAAGAGTGGFAFPEHREVGAVAYDQMLPGWSHPRWTVSPAASTQGAPSDPVYFDNWAGLGQMQIEGQEGSAVDRAWRLVAHPPMLGPQAALRVWVRQRDGYPLKYQVDFVKGNQLIVFDRFNGNPKVTPPPPGDLLPPPANLPDAGSYSWNGGSVRVLAVDRHYQGSLTAAPAAGSHYVGVEVFIDSPNQQIAGDAARWELVAGGGLSYPARGGNGAGANFGKGGGGDQVVFFNVPDSVQGPLSLHVVLVDYSLPPSGPTGQAPVVVLDTVIKLAS